MKDVLRWLGGRKPAAPPSLRAALRAAVERSDPGAGALQDRLAATGLAELRRVVGEPSTREHAIDLLAADALITYACEAAIEAAGHPVDREAVDPVERLTRDLSPDRFAGLMGEGVQE